MNVKPLSLTNRLLLYFMGALALVLVGFSISLYLCAHYYLRRQMADSLESASNTLIAAVEVSPEGVEWEPSERFLAITEGPLGSRIDWLITAPDGHVVDRSPGAASGGLLEEAANGLADRQPPKRGLIWEGQRWQLMQRRISPDSAFAATLEHTAEMRPNEMKHPMLAVTVGVPLDSVQSVLRGLAGGLAGGSATVWCLALLGGRWMCQRALAPVRRVAESAEAMTAADLHERLPLTGSADELDHLVGAFNLLLNRLHESFDRQQRFAGDASHQLRTPLTAMMGQVDVALRRTRPTEEYERILRSVHGQACRLHAIVEALLRLARFNDDQTTNDLQCLELNDWLQSHLETWRAHPRYEDFKLIKETIGESWGHVQLILLAELVNNLLDNAVKYSPPGSPILIRIGDHADKLSISVEDKGCGIPSSDLPHIFDPFFRSELARRRGDAGIGLGLAIASRLAEAIGARIEVSSERDRGSRFDLWIPASERPTRDISTRAFGSRVATLGGMA